MLAARRLQRLRLGVPASAHRAAPYAYAHGASALPATARPLSSSGPPDMSVFNEEQVKMLEELCILVVRSRPTQPPSGCGVPPRAAPSGSGSSGWLCAQRAL